MNNTIGKFLDRDFTKIHTRIGYYFNLKPITSNIDYDNVEFNSDKEFANL